MTNARKIVWTFFSLACAVLALDCGRAAVSEYIASSDTAESVHRAISLWPYRADYYRYLGVLEPDRAGHWFTQALARNPRDTRSWLRLGLQAEGEGNYQEAERCLLQAAAIDKTYEPRWTLANYYFRRGNDAQLWNWAQQAVAVAHDELTPLFDLCWRTRPDAARMLSEIVPADCLSRRKFFEYLWANAAVTQAHTLYDRLLPCADDSSRTTLAQYSNWLIFNGRPERALQVWNGLLAARAFPFRNLDVERGQVLTNGNFDMFPTQLGFDWHLDAVPGVTATMAPGLNGLRLLLDGSEPETTVVLYQPVVLRAHADYRLSVEVSSSQSEFPAGFRWRLADLSSGAPVALDGEDLAGPAGLRHWQFRGANQPVSVLVLLYQRPLGGTRFQGAIDLHRVNLEAREPAE